MKRTLVVIIAFLSLSFNVFAAVNINTASQAELETLNGIGPVKAKAIIDYRKKNGAFKSIDDLDKVEGIGGATVKNIKKDVSLSGKTTAKTTTNKPSEKPSKATVSDKVKQAVKEEVKK